ncbi:MAG: hypothetical protein IT376_02630 [Polyangiaceae bacterium]|nr:hypothetical protein [Polyangiaceae bacterium]
MAALSAARKVERMGTNTVPFQYKAKQKGSTTIHKGAIVVFNAGYAAPGTAAAALVAIGVAAESSTNSGADGAASVAIEPGVYKFNNHGSNTVVAANVGSLAYIEDDNTVGNSATSKSAAGRIMQLDSDGVWVAVGIGLGS